MTDRLADIEQALLARWPESRLDPTLSRISALMDRLGNPQHRVPVRWSKIGRAHV